jgi:hypothetical protein
MTLRSVEERRVLLSTARNQPGYGFAYAMWVRTDADICRWASEGGKFYATFAGFETTRRPS